MHYSLFRIRRQASLLLLALFSILCAFAQTSVRGKVTDMAGMPLAGVTISVKGSSLATTTGPDGNFSISVPNQNSVLVFSYVGYQPQEVKAGSSPTIDLKLNPTASQLNEVVVVGYGTQRRREVTSAVATVSAEEFNKGNITNVAQLLQGKVSGLSISRPGGDPNGNFAIRLRGLSTLGAGTQPLVVVDGLVGADLNSIDPNDISSIDVLKDASAAAIYGTRGSAGVIIITTKKGSAGATSVNYNGSVTAEEPTKFTSNMSAEEYRALGKGTDYGANTNWYDEISRTAISHVHNLNLSGGSGGSTYSASVNYRGNQGVAINTGFKQLSGHLNLTQKALRNKLVFNFNLNTIKRSSDVGFPEAFKYATIFNPTAPIRSTDPRYDLTGGGFFESNFVDYANPVAVLKQNTNQWDVKRINVQGTAEYELVTGLKFLVRYGHQNSSNYKEAFLPRSSFHSRNFLGVAGFARNGYAFKGDDENISQLYENTLTYETKIRDLNISALGGYSYQKFLNKGLDVRGGNFITDSSANNLGTALDFTYGLGNISSYKNGSRLAAFFGRVNLNYNNIAFLSATLRREGSTQFGEENKWGMFPAVSVGFDISKVVDIPQVNNLKFRASYGVTGALPPQSYLSLPTLTAGGSFFYAGNNVYVRPYGPNQNPNPDLKWERKGELDLGLDFSVFHGRLNGNMDYYNRTTSDLIFNVNVPVPPNLVPNTWMNIGKLESSGFEMALNFDAIKKADFSWTTGGNFSTYSIKLASLDKTLAGSFVGATNLGTPGQEATQITRAVEGEKIGIMWGWIYDGVDQNGKYKRVDVDKNNKIDAADQTQIGNGLPKFEAGWTNTFQYKNFDLNFFLRGSFGHDLINTYRAFYENPNVASSYNVVKTKYFNPAITDGQIFTSLFVEGASFVKLDNATLGYNFELPPGSSFRNLRAFITGQNLFVITDYTGVDPEVRYADPGTGGSFLTGTGTLQSGNPLAPGVDRRETWVRTRAFTLGLNVGF